MIITIDGTASSGKSTISTRAAKQIGFAHVNSGSLYRAIALQAIKAGIPATDTSALVNEIKNKTHIEVRIEDGESVIYLNGARVAAELRSPEVTAIVPEIAKIPEIRECARVLQHKIAETTPNFIVEGRDVGSVVFPNADIKFFVTADLDARAKRRQNEYLGLGKKVPLDAVKEELAERDHEDSSRKNSPLVVPKGAITLDTTHLNIEEATAALIASITTHTKTYPT